MKEKPEDGTLTWSCRVWILKSATERILCCTSLINRFAFPKTTRRQKVLHHVSTFLSSEMYNYSKYEMVQKVTLNLKMHSAELFYLRHRTCEILPTVTLKPSSLSSPNLPPLTCAGCVLQAATLPEGGKGLVFGPRGPGGAPRGQVGGHVPRLCGSGWFRWRAEWVRAAEDGASESYRARKQEEEKEEEERNDRKRKEREDVAQMTGAWGGLIAVSVNLCICVCTCV